MHPSRDELNRYVRATRAAQSSDEAVRGHVQVCEFCREYCDNFTLFLDEEVKCSQLNLESYELSQLLPAAAVRAQIIQLTPLSFERESHEQLLAADSEARRSDALRCILMSEDQDVVLTIAIDPTGGPARLQVTTADERAAGFLMLEAPDSLRSYLTDANGMVTIDRRELENPASLKWQVRLPDAVFDLQKLDLGSDIVRSSSETELATPQGDLVRIQLSDHSDGISIAVRVVALHGRRDFKKARVVLTQPGLALIDEQSADGTSLFGSLNPAQAIALRVFESL